jgi:DNA-binding NarL/FixJ family response regulator
MGNERILIVEDDPLLAQALDRELSKNYLTKVVATARTPCSWLKPSRST